MLVCLPPNFRLWGFKETQNSALKKLIEKPEHQGIVIVSMRYGRDNKERSHSNSGGSEKAPQKM